MKRLTAITRWMTLVLCIGAMCWLGACNDDDEAGPTLNGNNTVYTLTEIGNSGISGTVTFAELSNGNATVVIDLNGTVTGETHPAHIHLNTAAEGGAIAISLEPVEGASGSSTTIVSALDDGTGITYNELLLFDGYVNIHESEANLGTLLAQSDIGQNALSGDNITYSLEEKSSSGVSGTATFYGRLNNETLVVLNLSGTPADGDHPAHIHFNTAAEGGGIAISLSNVVGSTGFSQTNVTQLDDGEAIEFQDLISFDGYINVHFSEADLGTIVAQGDVGQNQLNGESVSYPMSGSATGTATFYERLNGETLVDIELSDFSFSGDHPSHIHMGSIAAPGGIVISLTPVDANGKSLTSVTAFDLDAGGESVTYVELIDYAGYINVHISEADLATLVSQGDIGSNGP